MQEYDIITTPTQMMLWENRCLHEDFAFDFETTGLNPRKAKALGVSIATKDHCGWLPLRKTVARAGEKEVNYKATTALLESILLSTKRKIAHNLKFDMQVAWNMGLDVADNVGCTQVAAFTHDCLKRRYNLVDVCISYGITPAPEFDEFVGETPLSKLPVSTLAKYSVPHAVNTFKLHSILEKCLLMSGQWELYDKIEAPCIFSVAWIEDSGVVFDTRTARKMGRIMEETSIQLQAEIFEMVGEEFNIGSGDQLAKILFGKLRLPVQKYTEKGHKPSTDEASLLKLNHPVVNKVLEYKGAKKLRSTFINGALKFVEPDGRIHTSLNQTVAVTGRFSSSNPNLQNIPHYDKFGIRKLYVADDGFSLCGADYSQIEMRLAAIFSGDKALVDIYKNNGDIHSTTCKAIFGDVTPEQRAIAKTINFAVGYGMQDYSLSLRLGTTKQKAASYLAKYWSTYKGLQSFNNIQVKMARKKGYTDTLCGRRRFLYNINSSDFGPRAYDERISTNHPIQGTAAEIQKAAQKLLYDRFSRTEVKCVLSVHDEIVLESPSDIAKDVSREQVKIMAELNGMFPFDVPLLVEGKVGRTWEEIH
jgi:DNA polymerase-1